jgi:hypothetical protein
MRLKLILIVSIISSLIGALGIGVVLYLFLGSLRIGNPGGLTLILVCLVPSLGIVAGSFFVYRHTARRRLLQALLTAVISVFFVLSIFFVLMVILKRPAPAISLITESLTNPRKLDAYFPFDYSPFSRP